MPVKPTASFSHFEALDLRAGRIVRVEDALSRKPTYRLTIDLGPEIGTKTSCAALRNYPKESLVGRIVVCAVNFAPKRMGPETSEVLVLGVPDDSGETIFLTTESPVAPGGAVF